MHQRYPACWRIREATLRRVAAITTRSIAIHENEYDGTHLFLQQSLELFTTVAHPLAI